jgi:hypothetical protein
MNNFELSHDYNRWNTERFKFRLIIRLMVFSNDCFNFEMVGEPIEPEFFR